jgi:DNA-directed RNA polymerase sigma subunit (sigma70/sigma32)
LACQKAGPEELLLDAERSEWLNGLLDVLDPRARTAVEQRFGLVDGRKRTWAEIAHELDVVPEAARRLGLRALQRLRDQAMCQPL